MANNTILRKIMSFSPYIEVMIRNIYWKNYNIFSKYKQKKETKKTLEINKNIFPKIIEKLISLGIKKGSLIVVHSAYGPLKITGLKPNEIIDELLNLIGENGTLAMPGIPYFENELIGTEYSAGNVDNIIFEYDVQKTPIITGVLPKVLFEKKNAIRSKFPINSMVAFGPLAKEMMKNNFNAQDPLPCGIGSTWDFCEKNNAIIIGLGTDLTHSLTMIHVAEDRLDKKWPVKNWYRLKKFRIKDGDYCEEKILRERHPKWGTLHYAERTLCKDLIDTGILKTTEVEGVLLEVIKSNELLNFLNKKNEHGYPYYGVKKYLSDKNN